MQLRTIKELRDLSGKRVLLRVDFNVPLRGKKIVDDYKIRASLPTIQYLLDHHAAIIIVSHLGRPKKITPQLSLRPLARYLEKLVDKKVAFVEAKNLAQVASKKLAPGSITMLENIRFVIDEEKNTGALAKALASLADIFVLDGFAVAHRAAASVSGVAKFLPSYAGLLVANEVTNLSRVLRKPARPFVAVIGGAKLETKLPLIKKLLPIADAILVGGGVANTFLLSKGYVLGGSLVASELKAEAARYASKRRVILPVDVIVGSARGQGAMAVPVKQLEIHDKNKAIYDVGPATIKLFADYLKKARTIVWNGAMGFFEQPPFQYGTYAMAELLARRAAGPAFGVTGGGETVQVVEQLGLAKHIDWVSTGGGAMLEFLSGEPLPGLLALIKKS